MITIITSLIIDQIDKFLRKCFNLELVLIKLGNTRNKTAIKNIAEITCSNSII